MHKGTTLPVAAIDIRRELLSFGPISFIILSGHKNVPVSFHAITRSYKVDGASIWAQTRLTLPPTRINSTRQRLRDFPSIVWTPMAVVQIATSCTVRAITHSENHELAIRANTSSTLIQTRIQIAFKRNAEL